MKFLADECCDASIVKALRQDGHDIAYIVEDAPGISDRMILDWAFQEQRIILTEDKDFGFLVHRMHLPAYGIILIRFEVTERKNKVARVRELVNQNNDRLPNTFTVLSNNKIRFRPLRSL